MAEHTVDIASVRPGMRLAKDIRSGEGRILFPAGSAVTESMLIALRAGGLLRVSIESEAPTTPAAGRAVVSEDVLEEARAAVADDFALLPQNDPMIAAVYTLAVERQSRIILSKAGRSPAAKNSAPAFQMQKPDPVSIKKLLSSGLQIGTLPMIFHRLVEVINSPGASANDAAKVISADPALCAKLLRLVNSPFYGLATRIDTIPRAVVMVGTAQLVMLAMGATLVTAFKGIPVSIINMQSFWSHSLACGVASRILARQMNLDQPEGYFVAGLLHDIARLIIYTQMPAHTLHLMTEAKRRNCSVHSLEKEILGFTHEELGSELLRSWSCPQELVQRVQRHHMPFSGKAKEDAVLPAANLLAQVFGFGSSGELHPEPVSEKVWEALNILPDELPDLTKKMDDNVRELRSVLATAQ